MLELFFWPFYSMPACSPVLSSAGEEEEEEEDERRRIKPRWWEAECPLFFP